MEQNNNHAVIWILGIIVIILGATTWWVMRDAAPITPEEEITGGSPSGIMELPAATAVRTALAARAGSTMEEIVIASAEPTEWPDACLGLPTEGEMCAQVITSGFRVVAQVFGREYVYRTNADGSVVRLESERDDVSEKG